VLIPAQRDGRAAWARTFSAHVSAEAEQIDVLADALVDDQDDRAQGERGGVPCDVP
jgi:hypothetical protein